MPLNQEHVDDNSLLVFLKKNEYLFTILGAFLVLAFIFNSPQLISFVNPSGTNESIQIQCSINGSDLSSNPNNTSPITQINCTGSTFQNQQSGNNVDFNSSSSRSFSFICLLMALIVYLAICYDLYLALKQCVIKVAGYFTKPTSSDDIKKDCTILFIVPFFYQGAIWFVGLLLRYYPDKMPDAFYSTALTFALIETFALFAIASELDRAVQQNKKKTLLLSGIFLITGVILMFIAILPPNTDALFFLFLVISGIIFFLFSIKGIRRYLRIKNEVQIHEVI